MANNGRNRAEKRANARKKGKQSSDKPIAMRIAILVVLAALLIGFFLLPLLR